jgi:prophage antirepressor-like protein
LTHQTSQLIPFDFDGQDVRVLTFDDGHTEWVAKDVCLVLGILNVAQAARRLKTNEKGVYSIDTPGGRQEMVTVTEPGLYRLIFRSDKPEAERFQKWVFNDVLPSIRKTGSYSVHQSAIEDYPELKAIVQLAEGLAETRKIADAAHAQAQAAELRAVHAEGKADLAIATQHILTIRDYVHLHNLRHQLSPAAQRDYGRYLTEYCLERNIPVRAVPVADRPYASEHGYHVQVITDTLHNWLFRRVSQANLTVLPSHET